MRIGHASKDENNKARGGKPGDQTQKEVCVRSFYSKPWEYLLRCKDPQKAEAMARACEAICKNDLVGYNQDKRNTLYLELKKINFDYTRLNVPCECDCSSFMTVCAICAGIPVPYGTNAPRTANMVSIFKNTGFFDVITDKSIINNAVYLKRGDILVGAPNTHTVMALDNGGGRPLLRLGSRGADVKEAQRLLLLKGYDCKGIDGIFGENTKKAVIELQKAVFANNPKEWDGVIGAKTWEALTNN